MDRNPAIPSARADLDLQIRTNIQQSQSLKLETKHCETHFI
jgi:hypothetical protein